MRGSPISRSSSGRSPLPQGSRVTVALKPRSLLATESTLSPRRRRSLGCRIGRSRTQSGSQVTTCGSSSRLLLRIQKRGGLRLDFWIGPGASTERSSTDARVWRRVGWSRRGGPCLHSCWAWARKASTSSWPSCPMVAAPRGRRRRNRDGFAPARAEPLPGCRRPRSPANVPTHIPPGRLTLPRTRLPARSC